MSASTVAIDRLDSDQTGVHASGADMRRLAAASSIGTTLEWYDFTVYNLMAALVFNVIFFPSFDPLSGTVIAFSTYAVGYLSRPLGGIVFGSLGDKLGRRWVLVATLILMGVVTGLMGVLPTYASWGIWSPILLVVLRFFQGAAIGGEWAGSVLLSMEHGKPHQRGRNASFTQVGPACGTLLGAGFMALITFSMTPESFQEWGWRIPFLSSVLLVILGCWLRRGVDETPVFKAIEEKDAKVEAPVRDVFVGHWRRLLLAGCARIGSDIVYAMLVVFSLAYVTNVLHLPRSLALGAAIVGAAFHAVCVPLFGMLSDKLGRRPVYAAGAVFSGLWVFVFFRLMDTASTPLIFLAMVVGMIFQAMMFGPQAAFVTEQFPTRVRYAGSSLAYTLGGILGGGTAPLIITGLFKVFDSSIAVSLYVCAGLAITLIALGVARETAHNPLQE
ncbi:MFS transporter [Pseudomonas tolaasii]|uniref:MFS transporter n=1 Tax=Pseudomonas tolaasii TaxID=29442 RepID=UPI00159FFFBB|nr:MFS transporter [Pseudomonas tolaasii]NVZ48451.1 MHS family MFS transporter [Pseudomonas tolaasii]NWA48108.1 MHS family MFS transporter [Pseudomonas tolaasii]QXQ20872.1 MHS family MFS transporter [Pseudomonas tolaasii]